MLLTYTQETIAYHYLNGKGVGLQQACYQTWTEIFYI